MVVVGVGNAKTEDISRLDDVPEGALHLALAYQASESQSDEWPAVGEAARTPGAYIDGCRTGWRGGRQDDC